MKTLDDILADFSFHDSTLKKIHYENDKKDLILDVDLPKRDFSDTKLNCIIKYENISIYNSLVKLSEYRSQEG